MQFIERRGSGIKKIIGELIINFTNYSDVYEIFATAVAKNIKNRFEFISKFKAIFYGNKSKIKRTNLKERRAMSNPKLKGLWIFK